MKITKIHINNKIYQPIKTNNHCVDKSLIKLSSGLTFYAKPTLTKKISAQNRKFIVENIKNFKNNNQLIEQIGKGTFGTVYKFTLPLIGSVAVKILNIENQNNLYGGGDLEKEAQILSKIPSECRRSQKLIDFFNYESRDYLITNFIPGKSLSSQDNISQNQMDNIVDELYKYDINNLMFYDLNPDNIKVDNFNVGFFDFEFLDSKNQLVSNCSIFNDLHHIGRNLYHPQKSNVNAFENRSLGKFLIKLDDDISTELVKKYLNSLSNYHSRMSTFYSQSKTVSDKAKNYENILSRLYKNPNKEIVSIEKNLIYLKSLTLNYYLYLRRKRNNNALLEDDYKFYTDFNKFIDNLTNRVKEVENKIRNLALIDDSDIQEYCKINSLYLESFLKINCSKRPLIIDRNSSANKLKQLKEEVIKNKDFSNIEYFLEFYKQTKTEYVQNPEYFAFCDDIKEVLIKTLQFIKENKL